MSYVAHLLSTPIMEVVSDNSPGEMKFRNGQEKDYSDKIEDGLMCNGDMNGLTEERMETSTYNNDGEDCDTNYRAIHSGALENGDEVMDTSSDVVKIDNCEGVDKFCDKLENEKIAPVPINVRTCDSSICPEETLPECDIHPVSNSDSDNFIIEKSDPGKLGVVGEVKSDSVSENAESNPSHNLEISDINSDHAEPKDENSPDVEESNNFNMIGESDNQDSNKDSENKEDQQHLASSNDSPKDLDNSVENIVDKSNSESAIPKVSSPSSHHHEGSVSDSSPDKSVRKKKAQPLSNTTPRRSSRNLNKTKSYNDEAPLKPEEGAQDLSKNQSADSRKSKNNTIVVNDTKRLAEIAVGSRGKSGKKEPTLVIIDTNSLIGAKGASSKGLQGMSSRVTITQSQGRSSSWPVNLPQSGIYHQKSVKVASLLPAPAPVSQPKPVILPSLTDDMFVVEAPSFIVPYVYEKPPLNTLKDFLKELGSTIKKTEKKIVQNSEEESKKESECDLSVKTDTEEKNSTSIATAEAKDLSKSSKDAEKGENSCEIPEDIKESSSDKNGVVSEEAVKVESNSAQLGETKDSDVEPHKEQSAVDNREKNDSEKEIPQDKDENSKENVITDELKKKVKADDSELTVNEMASEKNKKLTESDVLEDKTNKRSNSYFDNPLGKFFMQIGINLVQEHVQTDLLRSQQRKREKESKSVSPDVQMAIMSLSRTLQSSKENNEPFKFELKKCQMCNFKTESQLVMAHHLETPHVKNFVFRCSFCKEEVRNPHDILFHMESEHNVRGRLERTAAFHQCPNCPFEDNQKGKLSRHLLSCAKKYKPERNQEPPLEWEPPAKIPRMRGISGSLASSNAQAPPRLVNPSPAAVLASQRRGRQPIYLHRYPSSNKTLSAHLRQGGMVFRPAVNNSSQPSLLLSNPYQLSSAQLLQGKAVSNGAAAKLLQQPSISITPLPRSSASDGSSGVVGSGNNCAPPIVKPGRPPGTTPSKTNFVICEICDGYIKDLEQLRNHMQWIHKVKIHPKMMYNRPPLNCQKCQFRFFTDQGLERHLLGSHGLVTSSMQEAANKGKDGGRCPVCGRVYQWKLLNHVARDHNMSLKPAHLSYKCTVCTATFGMYKQFENHVYSAHSVVAKKVIDKTKNAQPSSCSSQSDSPLKPLKINDEITIIPQPARAKAKAFVSPKLTK